MKTGDRAPRPKSVDSRTCNEYDVKDNSPEIVHVTTGTGAGEVDQGQGLGRMLDGGTCSKDDRMMISGFAPYMEEYGEDTWIAKVTVETVATADDMPATTPGNEGAGRVVRSTEDILTGKAGVAAQVTHTEYPAGLLGNPPLIDAKPTVTESKVVEKAQLEGLLVIVPGAAQVEPGLNEMAATVTVFNADPRMVIETLASPDGTDEGWNAVAAATYTYDEGPARGR